MTTNAICKERGSDWSHQVSAVATTRWLPCDQTLPLSVKGVACETMSDVEDLAPLPPPPPPPPHTHTHMHRSTYVDGNHMISFVFRLVPTYARAWEQGYHTIHKTVYSLIARDCSAFYLFQYILEKTKSSVRAGLYKFFIKFVIKRNINRTILAFY